MGNHILRLGVKLHARTPEQFFIRAFCDTAQFFVVFFAKFEKIQDFRMNGAKCKLVASNIFLFTAKINTTLE
jgi:hypothetical protein